MKLSKLPGISYLRRYWWVLLAVILGYLLADYGWNLLDIFAYLPLVFGLWITGPLLFRNIFNRTTTDAYVDQKTNRNDGTKVKQITLDFESMDSVQKVWFTMIQNGIYLLGSAIVVHAIASNLFSKQ